MEGIAFLGIQGGGRIITVHNPFYGDHFDAKCFPKALSTSLSTWLFSQGNKTL